MGKYASGLFYLILFIGITIWIFVVYLNQSADLKKLNTVYLKQCPVLAFYEYDKVYTLVTSLHDTLTITKAYNPGLTMDSLTQIYAETPCRIYYIENEIVKLTQGSSTFVDINYLEIKKEYLDDGPLSGVYGMLSLCLVTLLVTLSIPKFATWIKQKNEQAILRIPYTKKISADLFEYKHMEKEALIHNNVYFQFSKTGNTNMITVYFPHPENLLQPINMERDAFQGGTYYNFTYRIIFSLNYKKLQQKIESKFA